jgi:hypothetical protein
MIDGDAPGESWAMDGQDALADNHAWMEAASKIILGPLDLLDGLDRERYGLGAC